MEQLGAKVDLLLSRAGIDLLDHAARADARVGTIHMSPSMHVGAWPPSSRLGPLTVADGANAKAPPSRTGSRPSILRRASTACQRRSSTNRSIVYSEKRVSPSPESH